MEKQLALTFILIVQPIFALLLWKGARHFLGNFMQESKAHRYLVLVATALVYVVFAYMFAKGFLQSPEAVRLGF